ncbi:MAG TPA: response regulator [Geobacteraceae bacterium]|nr:response regulator [Geobacteraceae bacterium]
MDDKARYCQVGPGRALLMDDQDSIREILREMLEELGWDVVCSCHGAEAVALYRKSIDEGMPFSMIILDLEVPNGIGGKEVMDELLPLDPDVRAVVSSGYYDEPVLANYQNYGFHAVLAKPYRIEDLTKVLRELR